MFLVKPSFIEASDPITRSSIASYTDSQSYLTFAAVNEIRPIIETSGTTNLHPSPEATGFLLISGGNSATLDTAYATSINSDMLVASTASYSNTNVCHLNVNDSTITSGSSIGMRSSGNFSVTSGNTYTFSVYLKTKSIYMYEKVPYIEISLRNSTIFPSTSVYGISLSGYSEAGSVGIVSGSFNSEVLVNGWRRISFRFTATTSENLYTYFHLSSSSTVSTNQATILSDTDPYPNSIRQELYIFGCQVETGNLSSFTLTTRAPDVLPIIDPTKNHLLSSNIPIDDYAEWSIGTSYTTGQRVIYTAGYSPDIFEAVANSTGVIPTSNPTKWLNIGATNRWKMFDSYLSTSTSSVSSGIQVAIKSSTTQTVDSICLLNVVAKEVRVIISDATEGEVFNQLYQINTSSLSESTWYSYFFETPISKSTFVIDDLPKVRDVIISVLLNNDDDTTSLGLLTLGKKEVIGDGVEYGTTVGIVDYSVKEVDQFGNFNITERAYSDRVNYRVYVNKTDVAPLKRVLASVRSTPCLYVGNKDIEATITYGYYKNFDIALQFPEYSDYNLEIEGLT